MAVSIDNVTTLYEQGDLVSKRVAYSGASAGNYDVYQNGVLIAASTTLTQWDFTTRRDESLMVEILDGAGTGSPTEIHGGRAVIGWDAVSGVDHYRVEEKVSSVWTLRQQVRASGKAFFNWTSRFLEDVTTHYFRVIPVDAAGDQGAIREFQIFMVRNPDPIDLVFVYNAGAGTVTMSAA